MRHFRIIYLIPAVCFALFAQTQAQNTEKAPLLNIEFQVYIWPNEGRPPMNGENVAAINEGDLLPEYVGQKIGLLDGNTVSLLSADRGRLSSAVKYTGAGPIRFVDYDSPTLSNQPRPIIAEVHPPVSMTKGLFIFFPTSQGTTKYQLLAIDTSQEALSTGNSFFYNITPSKIAIKVGDRQMQMKPMEHESVELDNLRDSKLPIQIAVESGQSGDWTLRYSTRKVILPDSRLIFLIYNPKGKKSFYRILTLNADK